MCFHVHFSVEKSVMMLSLTSWFNPTIKRDSEKNEDIQAITNSKSEAFYTVHESNDIESYTSSEHKEVDHVFQDPQVAEYYKNIYESTNYECKDYFDPEYTWTSKEERKLVWKLDWYVTFWAYFMFTALDFDRNNITQAVSDNMLDDLGLDTGNYNIGNTINLVCFLGSELPSQLISKKLGADVWIPTQLVLWSAVSISQAALTGRKGYYATRGLLGAFQGGFICDTCLWMSYFYTSKELPFRLSLFYIANPLTSVFSSLLAFAVLRIKTSILPHGWQWLFIVEGVFTFLVGLISYFKMPPSAVQTKTWFRKKGWFSEHEEKIVVNRVLRDEPTKGDMNNRQPVGVRELVKVLLDYDLLPIYFVRILGDIGTSPVSTYMTLTLKKLGFSTFNTNLLTIPYNILSIITMLICGYLSEIVQSRSLIIAITPLWIIALMLPLRYWPGSQVEVWPTYVILTLLLGHAPIWPLTISWCSSNSNAVRTRAVSAAVVNIFSQAAGIISANIYLPADKPLYKNGNVHLLGIAFGALGMCLVARYYYILRNRWKEKKWNQMTKEEQKHYTSQTTDKGNKRLDFRFVY